MPLLKASLMSSRGLALNLCKHIPIHIRRVTMSAMRREDQKRARSGYPLVNKDWLITIAQEEEYVLEFEAEMRASGQVPGPRPTVVADVLHPPQILPKPPRPMVDRLQQPSNIKERLGARTPSHLVADGSECHQCHHMGLIAKNCTQKRDGAPSINNNKFVVTILKRWRHIRPMGPFMKHVTGQGILQLNA